MPDNTTLPAGGGGDTLATEEIATGNARSAPGLPTTAYKVPRTKIALGDYDDDRGDVAQDKPLPVDSARGARFDERTELRARDAFALSLVTRGGERSHQRQGQSYFGRDSGSGGRGR